VKTSHKNLWSYCAVITYHLRALIANRGLESWRPPILRLRLARWFDSVQHVAWTGRAPGVWPVPFGFICPIWDLQQQLCAACGLNRSFGPFSSCNWYPHPWRAWVLRSTNSSLCTIPNMPALPLLRRATAWPRYNRKSKFIRIFPIPLDSVLLVVPQRMTVLDVILGPLSPSF
jgi:hypothetical protein